MMYKNNFQPKQIVCKFTHAICTGSGLILHSFSPQLVLSSSKVCMGAATACFALVRPACGILQRRPGRFAAHPEGDTIHAGTQADKTRSISFAGRARQCRLSGGAPCVWCSMPLTANCNSQSCVSQYSTLGIHGWRGFARTRGNPWQSRQRLLLSPHPRASRGWARDG